MGAGTITTSDRTTIPHVAVAAGGSASASSGAAHIAPARCRRGDRRTLCQCSETGETLEVVATPTVPWG